MAINRDVIAKWIPSLTPDVVAQKVVWTLNGAVVSSRLIGARVSSRSFAKDIPNLRLQEGDTVQFSVCAVDEFGESTSIVADTSFVITAPDAPSNLNLYQKIKYRRVP